MGSAYTPAPVNNESRRLLSIAGLTEHRLELNMVPNGPWIHVANALAVGADKYVEWDSDKGTDYYLRKINSHLKRFEQGEVLDADNGHHHLSAVVVRCLQIMDGDNPGG